MEKCTLDCKRTDQMAPKTLILLHGALGSEKQFDQLKKELDSQFDVRVLTFEGHGGVPLKDTFGMQTFVNSVLLFMTHEGLETASFFGFSMGGYVALKLASMYPERVDKVVTYGTKFDWTPEFSVAEVRKLNPEKIAEKVPHFAKHLSATHAPLDWKKVVTDTAEMMLSLGENNELGESDYLKILNPTLVLLGKLDRMSTVEESKEVAAFLPNGDFEHVPDFEHAIEKINHVILAKRIVDFLN